MQLPKIVVPHPHSPHTVVTQTAAAASDTRSPHTVVVVMAAQVELKQK